MTIETRERVNHAAFAKRKGGRSHQRDFDELREKALDLLEWSLNDISPDPDHTIHVITGMEREGNFVDSDAKNHEEEWYPKRVEKAGKLASALHAGCQAIPDVSEVYYDDGATFQIELVTKAVTPKRAALAAKKASCEMERLAVEQEGYQSEHIRFGTLNVDFLKDIPHEMFADYDGEVFSEEKDEQTSLLLSGRGQHANVSVWCGNQNLYYAVSKHNTPHYASTPYKLPPVTVSLTDATANAARQTLPGMILPCRNGNYLDIARGAEFSINTIDMAHENKYVNKALNMRKKPRKEKENLPYDEKEISRIEFRQCSADADPLDAALAAAIPATKACLEYIVRDDKGVALLKDNRPQFNFSNMVQAPESAMPKNAEHAKRLFNTQHNPNFDFLNKLAEQKFAKMEIRCKNDNNQTNRQELKNAAKLIGIGTRLHAMYCQQYGMESVMEQPAITQRLG